MLKCSVLLHLFSELLLVLIFMLVCKKYLQRRLFGADDVQPPLEKPLVLSFSQSLTLMILIRLYIDIVYLGVQ